MKYIVMLFLVLFSLNLYAVGFGNNGVNVQEYVWDKAVDGGAITTYTLSSKAGYAPLPDGAIILDVIAWVETAPVTTTSGATISWGDGNSGAGFSGTTIAVASLAINTIWHAGVQGSESLLWDDTNDHMTPYRADTTNERAFKITIATDTVSAGKIRFSVLYLLPGTK